MYKKDLALNNLQYLMCHKTKPNPLYSPDSPTLVVYEIFPRLKIYLRVKVKMIDLLILMACQFVQGYFIPKS